MAKKLVVLTLLFLMCGSLNVNIYAHDIGFKGEWDEGKYALSPDIPIEAFIQDGLLVIKSSSLRSDITLKITNASTVAYEMTISADQTDYACIDLNGLESGTYFLELTNQWGDHVYGCFQL